VIFGVSGRAMLDALIDGERDPKVLAQLARTRMRAKIGALEEAFVGHFTDHHAFLLTRMLARIDAISADIAEVEARIEVEIAPFADAVERLDEITGVGRVAAHVIIAEVGLDMTRPHSGASGVLGPVRPGSEGVRRPQEGHRQHRARQPLPGSGAGRGRDRREQDQHLPRSAGSPAAADRRRR